MINSVILIMNCYFYKSINLLCLIFPSKKKNKMVLIKKKEMLFEIK